jgi:hypothetical protein
MSRNKSFTKYLFIILGIILLFLGITGGFVYFQDFKDGWNKGPMFWQQRTTGKFSVQEWMSISYIAKLNKVPESDIFAELHLDQNIYSNLSIRDIAANEHMDLKVFIAKIQNILDHRLEK